MKLIGTNRANLDVRIPFKAVTGDTPYISQYMDFGWYDWACFKENNGLDLPRLGRFQGFLIQQAI